MRSRLVFWSVVLATPVAVYFMLTVGRQYDDYLGGRLMQVLGGFVGLGWTTWMFLVVAQALTHLFHVDRTADDRPKEEPSDAGSSEPGRPPRRRAA